MVWAVEQAGSQTCSAIPGVYSARVDRGFHACAASTLHPELHPQLVIFHYGHISGIWRFCRHKVLCPNPEPSRPPAQHHGRTKRASALPHPGQTSNEPQEIWRHPPPRGNTGCTCSSMFMLCSGNMEWCWGMFTEWKTLRPSNSMLYPPFASFHVPWYTGTTLRVTFCRAHKCFQVLTSQRSLL